MRQHLPWVVCLLAACGGASASTPNAQSAPPAQSDSAEARDASWDRGMARAQSGDCAGALREDFGPLIEREERQYEGVVVRASRIQDPGITLLLLSEAAAERRQGVVIDAGFPDSIYLAAYCAVEIEDFPLAERYLQRALEILPNDPGYLCELGHIHQTRRDFQKALETFTTAEASAAALEAHPRAAGLEILNHDLPWWRRRALRGQGFALIELARLDEAEAIYHRVLAIDPGDAQARTELQVIAEMRARGATRP